jgi:hypothetical protein
MPFSLFEGFNSQYQRSSLLSRRSDVNDTKEESKTVDRFATPLGRPKLKFNFTVSLKFREPFKGKLRAKLLNEEMTDGELVKQMTFAIKQASRPVPTVVYQDVNHYNYRTKVATKTDYGSMQLTFYDDVSNVAHDMYEAYLKALSPIANLSASNASSLIGQGHKNVGFNSTGSSSAFAAGSGSVGPLSDTPGGENGIIESIVMRHWYYSTTESRSAADANRKQFDDSIQYTDYEFLNPRIINMTLDELDMTQSDANTVMMNFVYDSVYINSPTTAEQYADEGITDRLSVGSLSSKPGDQGILSRIKDKITETVKNQLPNQLLEDVKRLTKLPDDFTLNDIRSKVTDAERIYRRVKSFDTLPDIPVIDILSDVLGPLGNKTIPGNQGETVTETAPNDAEGNDTSTKAEVEYVDTIATNPDINLPAVSDNGELTGFSGLLDLGGGNQFDNTA